MPLKVDGLRELQEQLLEVRNDLSAQKALVRAARKALEPVLEDARRRVPVDTGLTRDSLKIATRRKAGKDSDAVAVAGLRVAVGKGGGRRDIRKAKEASSGEKAQRAAQREAWRRSAHWRWHFIEFGTAKTPAKPFIRPAFDPKADAMVQTVKAEIAKDIQRALKKKRGKRGRR